MDWLQTAGLSKRVFDDERRQAAADKFTEAQRADQVASFESEAGLRPMRAAQEEKDLALRGAQTDSAINMQPQQAETQRLRAQEAAERAKRDLSRLPEVFRMKDAEFKAMGLEIQNRLAAGQFSLDDWPRQLSVLKKKGAIEKAKVADMFLGGLGLSLSQGDEAATLKYFNQGMEVSENGPDGLKGRVFTSVVQSKNKETGDIDITFASDDSKAPITISGKAIGDAYKRFNPVEGVKLGADDTLVNPKDGSVMARGTPKMVKLNVGDGKQILVDPSDPQLAAKLQEAATSSGLSQKESSALWKDTLASFKVQNMSDIGDDVRSKIITAFNAAVTLLGGGALDEYGRPMNPNAALTIGLQLADGTITPEELRAKYPRRSSQQPAAQGPSVQGGGEEAIPAWAPPGAKWVKHPQTGGQVLAIEKDGEFFPVDQDKKNPDVQPQPSEAGGLTPTAASQPEARRPLPNVPVPVPDEVVPEAGLENRREASGRIGGVDIPSRPMPQVPVPTPTPDRYPLPDVPVPVPSGTPATETAGLSPLNEQQLDANRTADENSLSKDAPGLEKPKKSKPSKKARAAARRKEVRATQPLPPEKERARNAVMEQITALNQKYSKARTDGTQAEIEQIEKETQALWAELAAILDRDKK